MKTGINDSVLQLLVRCPHLEAKWQRERAEKVVGSSPTVGSETDLSQSSSRSDSITVP
jgi:hypothetical protein